MFCSVDCYRNCTWFHDELIYYENVIASRYYYSGKLNSQIQLNKIEANFIFVFDCFILARKRSFLVSSVFLWFFEKRRKKQCFSFYSFFVLQSMFVFGVFNLTWLTSGSSAWNLFPEKTIVRHFSVCISLATSGDKTFAEKHDKWPWWWATCYTCNY